MPNYVKNVLRFEGDKNRVRTALETIKDDELGFGSIDFNKIIPMPAALLIESGSRAANGLRLYKKFVYEYGLPESPDEDAVKEGEFLEKLDDTVDAVSWVYGKQAFYNKQKYGYSDWYGWRIDNWGTKWNACETYGSQDVTDKIEFQTAWSAPEPVVAKLSEMFPDLTITLTYADEDLGVNCGEIQYENGRRVYYYEGDLNFACNLWGYSPEDFEEDDLI